jgi:hypothetical protein
MNCALAYAVLLALGTGGSFAADVAQTKPSEAPSPSGPGANEDSLNIELVKMLDVGGGYVRLEGPYLFLTSNVNLKAPRPGFWFDVESDPTAPALLHKSLPGAWDVAVTGDHAVVCDYTSLLKVFDLRDHQWRQVAALEMPSMTENLTIRGKLAYVANHVAGLTVVDVADPARPSIVSNFNPRIDCDGLALWKDYAVLYGHWESRLVLVDVADPAKPRQTGVYQHDKGSFNQGEVTVDGDFAYCTSNNGLVIVNIADPAGPKLVRTVNVKGGIRDVAVKDGYVFVAAGKDGVRVFDVSDTAHPAEVGRYPGKRAGAFELAVLRVPPAEDAAESPARATTPKRELAESYYIYAAARPAAVLRFRPPAQNGDGSRKEQ